MVSAPTTDAPASQSPASQTPARTTRHDARPGTMLAQVRRQVAMTQSEVAARAGVPQSTVSAYESGVRQPTLPMLSKLLEAMGHELAIGTQPMPGRLRALSGPIGTRLRRHRHQVLELAARQGVGNVRVIGGVARGEERTGERLEFLVDLSSAATLTRLRVLDAELRDLLGLRPHLIVADRLPPEELRRLEQGAVTL